MSVKVMGLVWDLTKDVIEREEKYVLLAYADHADHKGYNIYPSVPTIMAKTLYEERSVQLITRALVQKGFLVPDGKGPHGTNKWRIPLDEGGAKIAPVNFAPVQKTAERGAKPTGEGVQPVAPEPSEPPESNKEIEILEEKYWQAVIDQIRPERNYGVFNLKTASTRVIRYDGNGFVVAAPDEETRVWLECNLKAAAEKQLLGILNQEVNIWFVLLDEVPA
jgi:hypothetical protein